MGSDSQRALRIVVAESSVIIRAGIVAVLKRIPGIIVHPIEVSTCEALLGYVKMQSPDAVIVDILFGGWFDVNAFLSEIKPHSPKMIALVGSVTEPGALRGFDYSIGFRDDIESISKVFEHIQDDNDDLSTSGAGENVLSMREKEILVCIVKGMTNKEIADKLFISVHTVVTHRRNVARKLQIHSSAGLTIYAIVNKLVALDEIDIS